MEAREVMRILYCAMRWDYGDKSRGECHEQVNFHHTLINMGYEIIQFDFMDKVREVGVEKTNKLLIQEVKKVQPDLVFAVLFEQEIYPETIETITNELGTLTLNWFTDDHWRFDNFSQYYAPPFSFVATTDPQSVPKYHSIGYKNVILSQWACNQYLYKPIPGEKTMDAAFIGMPHGDRKKVIGYLRQNGVDVKTRGYGWPEGRLTQEQMIETFSRAKINLNLANSSTKSRIFFWRKGTQQIKGRNFEVPGCGGFLMTNYVAHLEDYFEIGKEVVCFEDKKDLLEKVRYYLNNDEEREKVAQAGYERTINNHTYEKRFLEIFQKMGLE